MPLHTFIVSVTKVPSIFYNCASCISGEGGVSIGKHTYTSTPRGSRGLTINLTRRFLRLWVEPGVPREKQHKRRKNMHKEKPPKPGIRSANHCTLCQFYYYSFLFSFFLLIPFGNSVWLALIHEVPRIRSLLTAATVSYCCSWTIESFLMKGNLEGRKCFSFISFYLKCLKARLKIRSCQRGYMANSLAGLAISNRPAFLFLSFLFTILQMQKASARCSFFGPCVISRPLVFFYAPDNTLKCNSLQTVTYVKL